MIMRAILKNLENHLKVPKTSWKLWLIVAILSSIITAIGTMIAQEWITFFKSSFSSEQSFVSVWNVLGYIIAIVLWVLVIFIFAKWDKAKSIWLKRINTKKVLIYSIVSVILFNIFIYLWDLILPQTKTSAESTLNGFWFGQTGIWDIMIILSTTVIAPISEELIFRWIAFGSIFSWLARFKKIWISIALILTTIITSLYFGSIHLEDGQAFYFIIPYFLLSVVFTYVYLRTDSLYTAIVSHSINNSFVIMMTLLSSNNLSTATNLIYPVIILSPFIVFLLSYLLEKILSIKKN